MPEFHRQPGPPFNILIVEDSPEDRELYQRMLKRHGGTFRTFEAATIHDGLRLAGEQRMDCVLVDYQLPDGDGLDFIHRYHQLANGNAAIVMVTGRGSERTAAEAFKLGALDYITKGSILEGFFTQSILNAIERHHLKEEVARYQRELEQSYRALSDFAHTASHDLKAPLRHIGSYCDIIREDYADKLGEKGKEYVTRLGVNARRLQALVDDLLAYSEAMNAQEEKAAVDTGAVMAEVLESLEEQVRESGAKVTAVHLPVILACPLRMRQMFQNLVTNALKYRSPDRPLTVSVTVEDRPNEHVFCVKDNGRGIAPEHMNTIFQPFKRLHSRDEIEGTGLGLSICRKIAEMHNGRIWVESQPGAGSAFYFTIPKPEVRRYPLYGTG